MAPPNVLDLLVQLPGNFGDPQGMRCKAAQLDQLAVRLDSLDRGLGAAVHDTTHYQGPAAEDFRRTMQARHQDMALLLGRLHAVRERLLRGAAVMQTVEDEVDGIRRRIKRDVDVLGDDAVRLVHDAQQLVRDLSNL